MLIDKNFDFFFSNLAKFKVVDKNNVVVGRPGDALLNEKDLSIHSFIIFGSMLEERLEDMGFKENIDPIVPINLVEKEDISKRIYKLKVSKDELKATDNNFTAPMGTIHLIKLKKLSVFDKNNEKIGRVIDIFFQKNGKFQFIIGGSALEEFLEKIKIYPDIDLIVPSDSIAEISVESIKLKVSKIDLKTTLYSDVGSKDISKTSKPSFIPKGYSNQFVPR